MSESTKSIKEVAARAKELRELADLVESGEVTALVWGFTVEPAIEGVGHFHIALQEGDAGAVRLMIEGLRAQVDKAPPEMQLGDNEGGVSVRIGEDGEGKYDAMQAYRDWLKMVEMVQGIAKFSGMSAKDVMSSIESMSMEVCGE